MSLETIKKYHIWAKKSLWQNFLVDEKKVQEIADTLSISWKNIIEVGPWYGALTERLLIQEPQWLHLVELDTDMISVLNERKSLWELMLWNVDFQIFHQDVLQFVPGFQNYSVVANIPYYITSPILRHFLYDIENLPQEMLILMQQDVGDKILGKWKNKSSVLSLMIEKKCRVEEKILVPKECFFPQPKIESSVLYFQTHHDFDEIDDANFLAFIKKWFLAPRKKLIKNLTFGGYDRNKIEQFFQENNFSENIRGEDMNISEWIQLMIFLGL